MAFSYSGRSNLPGPIVDGRFIVTPPTTDMALVFPLDQRKGKFDRNFYSPALTDGKISSEHLELFLRDAEEIIRKKIGKVRTLFKVFALWLAAGLFTMLFLALDSIDTDVDIEGDSFEDEEDIGAFFLSLMGYVFFIIFVSVLLCKFKRRSNNKARKAIQRLIDRKYSVFNAQGLRWNLPLHFPHWIELWKDYKGQTMYGQQGPQFYAPYVMTLPTQVIPQQSNSYPQLQSQPQSQPQPQPQPQPYNHRQHHNQPHAHAHTQLQFTCANSQGDQRSGLSQPLLSQQDTNLYPQLNAQN